MMMLFPLKGYGSLSHMLGARSTALIVTETFFCGYGAGCQ